MQKAHDATKNDYWRNKPLTTSPINQDNLNRMEVTMDVIDDRVVTFDTTKANQSDLLQTVKTITYAPLTGTFTFTHWNGSTTVINTDIEKIAINFDYDDDPTSPHYQHLVIELDDGTYKYIDMSSLITQYEFVDGTIVDFTVAQDGSVTADIKDGSITANKLQPNFLADCLAAKNASEAAADNAEESAEDAEAWAVGKRNGQDVPSTDPAYENNAKYWAGQAGQAVRGGHAIIDESGTSMTQRHNLQFAGGVNVTDDSENDKTVVTIAGGGVGGTYYATCSTAAATAAKEATVSSDQGEFVLKKGIIIIVRFTNENTATNATLNINNTGAKNVYQLANGGTTLLKSNTINAEDRITLVYDGNYYYIISTQRGSTEIWTPSVSAGIGDTDVTISHSAILANDASQVIDVYARNSSETYIGITSVVTTAGQAVITFVEPLAEATDFRLKITYI